jgi:hypothetical protein
MRPFNREIEFIPTMLFQRRVGAPPVDEPKIEALAHLLDWAGWPSPVILDDFGNVISGRDSVEAAKLFGDAHAAPTVLARNVTPEDRAAFHEADARLAAKVSGGAALLWCAEGASYPATSV